jgi:hypothetical protein
MDLYVLKETMCYGGTWVLAVVNNLDEALEYFSENIDNNNEEYGSTYYVEEWKETKRICSYKYNTKTHLLDKQKPRPGDLEYKLESE